MRREAEFVERTDRGGEGMRRGGDVKGTYLGHTWWRCDGSRAVGKRMSVYDFVEMQSKIEEENG